MSHLVLQALLRRLEKRILVPLPSTEARAAMFSNLLSGRCTPDVQWQQLAAATEGYSGEDRVLLVTAMLTATVHQHKHGCSCAKTVLLLLDADDGKILSRLHLWEPHVSGQLQDALRMPAKHIGRKVGSMVWHHQITCCCPAGSDVRLAAKEAAMRPLRRLMEQLEPELAAGPIKSSSSSSSKHIAGDQSGSCSRSRPGNSSSSSSQLVQQQTAGASQSVEPPDAGKADGSKQGAAPLLGSVTAEDVAAGLAATKPSAQLHSKEYALFTERYGQVA
jgi:SpoVK/Ycf46/Vps4 family AAA+-type ATPase